MLKEEILEKSRNEKTDEGMQNAENQGRKIGFLIFGIIFTVLALFNLFMNKTDTLYAIFAMFWVFSACEAYAKYRFTKKKTYLVTAIAGGVASLAFLANHILTVLG